MPEKAEVIVWLSMPTGAFKNIYDELHDRQKYLNDGNEAPEYTRSGSCVFPSMMALKAMC
jgi:hypothetical protein